MNEIAPKHQITFITHCSFCGKHAESEGLFLLIGPEVSICEDCTEAAYAMVQERRDSAGEEVTLTE